MHREGGFRARSTHSIKPEVTVLYDGASGDCRSQIQSSLVTIFPRKTSSLADSLDGRMENFGSCKKYVMMFILQVPASTLVPFILFTGCRLINCHLP